MVAMPQVITMNSSGGVYMPSAVKMCPCELIYRKITIGSQGNFYDPLLFIFDKNSRQTNAAQG
jgi:hypothetical protein